MLDGKHPVRWLLTVLSNGEGMAEALWSWLDEVCPGAVAAPSKVKLAGLGQKILHGVPLTALAYEMPSDGIPLFPTWRNNAMDMYWSGYDSLREPMECKERNLSAAHWQLQCTKGLGRLSMILFGVFWTFLHKDDMSDGVQADFCRWLQTVATLHCRMVVEQDPSHYDWKRLQTSEQQAQRERKSILQKALVFARRADSLMLEDSLGYDGPDGKRSAFLKAVQEYNNYGAAVANPRLQITEDAALELFALRAGVSVTVWEKLERHLHSFRWEQSAFSKDLLLEKRWLLQGSVKVSCSMWHSILTVDEEKQCLFIDRILMLHSISAKRASSRTILRLTQQEWCQEVDICCVLGWLLVEMTRAQFDDGTNMFPFEILDAALKRCIEGDFHSEMKEVLTLKDPAYQASFSACWQEHLPAVTEPAADESRFTKADEQLENLSKDARKLAYERDSLQFARDVATLG